jgi:hypothetical protein
MNLEVDSHHPGAIRVNPNHAKRRKSWHSILIIQGK